MTTTPHLNISLVEQSQSQKEVTVNAAIAAIDALMNTGAKDKDLATPPGSSAEGDVYIVAASSTGAWSGQAGKVAYYLNGAWAFLTPHEGLTLWVNDEDTHYSYDGSAWASRTDNLGTLGINTTADATNKLAVASSAVLFNHAGTNVQVKVNKNAAGDTASYVFQDNWSGRAEFGLIGSDDLTFKTSPDGSSFLQAFVLDKTTADTYVKQVLRCEKHLTLKDGVTAPSTVAGQAAIYVDTADGDLKVKFGDGTVKTIVTD